MKKCHKCKIEKPLIHFCVNKSKKDGFNDICKSCKKEYNKKYREINRESEIKRLKKWPRYSLNIQIQESSKTV
jgi:protein-arginine kinase activator protein McsA